MLLFAYFLSALALLAQATVLPHLPILAFTPFLALSCLLRNFDRALLCGCMAGLTIDLLASDPFGLHALTYSLSLALCYPLKNLFSSDEPMQLSLYTSLLSIGTTLIQVLLLFLFDRRIPFCGRWWMTDWIALPVVDAIYALIWFAGPLALFRVVRRRWVIYWLKKKSPSPT